MTPSTYYPLPRTVDSARSGTGSAAGRGLGGERVCVRCTGYVILSLSSIDDSFAHRLDSARGARRAGARARTSNL